MIQAINEEGKDEPSAPWFTEAKQLKLKISEARAKIDERAEEDMNEEDRKEVEEKKEAMAKWEELKGSPETQNTFIDWVWEKYVKPQGTDAKPKKPILEKERLKDFPHARAIIAKVSNQINPDKYK